MTTWALQVSKDNYAITANKLSLTISSKAGPASKRTVAVLIFALPCIWKMYCEKNLGYGMLSQKLRAWLQLLMVVAAMRAQSRYVQ